MIGFGYRKRVHIWMKFYITQLKVWELGCVNLPPLPEGASVRGHAANLHILADYRMERSTTIKATLIGKAIKHLKSCKKQFKLFSSSYTFSNASSTASFIVILPCRWSAGWKSWKDRHFNRTEWGQKRGWFKPLVVNLGEKKAKSSSACFLFRQPYLPPHSQCISWSSKPWVSLGNKYGVLWNLSGSDKRETDCPFRTEGKDRSLSSLPLRTLQQKIKLHFLSD